MNRPLRCVALFTALVPVSTTLGDVILFDDLGAFEAAALGQGKVFKGLEDFSENNFPAGFFDTFLDTNTLQFGVPALDAAGLGFPNGLAQSNLIVQTNNLGLNAVVPSPGDLMRVFKFPDNETTVGDVLSDTESMDMIFLTDKTAVGFDVITAADQAQITVFDTVGNQIFQQVVTTGGGQPLTFYGLLSDVPIGRINVGSLLDGELIGNIRMYSTPAPGGLGLLVLAMVGGRRRRG